MAVLLIDNFDSFTYNIVQAFQMLGAEVQVVRNHALSVQECLNLNPKAVVIGPGPGDPSHAGISLNLIRAVAGKVPLLGICLGHQAIAEAFGGVVQRADLPMHGKTSSIYHDGQTLFQALPQGFKATRYHSLIVDRSTLPAELAVSAETENGEVMALRHQHYAIEGVQYHPESVASQYGLDQLLQFMQYYKVNSLPR